jgi:glycosyltransferase involved in cell wall biosynthesis
MIHVGLDISQAVKHKARGIARYIEEVLPPLLNLSATADGGFDPVLFVRGDRLFRRESVVRLAEGRTVRWMPLGQCLSGRGIDLFHSFGNHLPALSAVPMTFTVHDFRVLDLETSKSGHRLRKNIARSSGVLCLTEHGRSRLLHYFPEYDQARIAVVPHGVDHDRFHLLDRAQALAVASRHGLQAPYLLQLGSWYPHKNLELSIESLAISRAGREGVRLAFVGGGASADYRSSLESLAQSKGVKDLIDWVEDVPSEDIPSVVAAAACLLQPSYYEGFALPLLEAMATGTPGVVSDSSCLPEVSGGAWPVAEQGNPDSFAAGIDQVMFDSERRAVAISAGLARASGFTWEETARKTLAFFKTILESQGV